MRFDRLLFLQSTLSVLMALVMLVGPPWSVPADAQSSVPAYERKKREANASTVTITASGTASPYTRFAEDIRNVLDDPKTNQLRVLPILGRGGGQNLLDILFLRGIDMGIVDQDHMERLRKKHPVVHANIAKRVHYITKLMNSEFQVLARKEFRTVRDLEGRKVNFFKRRSSTAIGAEKVFSTLGIRVQPVFYDQSLANQKLKTGEIAAAVRFAGAPHNAFVKFTAQDGVHFIPIDDRTAPEQGYNQLLEHYLPAYLRHEFYPQLIPQGQGVPTLANSTLLAVYAWPEKSERYRKVANFVNVFVNNIDKFRDPSRHPKWKEINLAANVKGWTRFKAAQDWIDARRPASARGSNEMQTAFDDFLRQQGVTVRGAQLTPRKREELFRLFGQWWQQQQATR